MFYGVQATGNGHITRARAMAPKLKAAGIDVTYNFTGRPRDELFEMDVFGDYEWRPGLTFNTKAGNVRYLQTVLHTNIAAFVRDVSSLDLSSYDIVVSDFEPVTAWAARLRGIKTVGIGHQYAFKYDIPLADADFMGKMVLRYFAPVDVGIGVHWHHFNLPVLPPVIESEVNIPDIEPNKIIIYLPFEDVDQVVGLLKNYPHYNFSVYSAIPVSGTGVLPSHISVHPLSRMGFRKDFSNAAGVICNAGFELVSEALQMGKKILVKPLHRQMEQLSNALALEQLGLGRVMHELDGATIKDWLDQGRGIRVQFPDVAEYLANWFLEGRLTLEKNWIESIWDRVERSEV